MRVGLRQTFLVHQIFKSGAQRSEIVKVRPVREVEVIATGSEEFRVAEEGCISLQGWREKDAAHLHGFPECLECLERVSSFRTRQQGRSDRADGNTSDYIGHVSGALAIQHASHAELIGAERASALQHQGFQDWLRHQIPLMHLASTNSGGMTWLAIPDPI